MGRVFSSALLALLIALPATAAQFADIDADGDKMATYEELATVYTDVTMEEFTAMDTNGDTFLDEAELTAAVEAGLIVETDE